MHHRETRVAAPGGRLGERLGDRGDLGVDDRFVLAREMLDMLLELERLMK